MASNMKDERKTFRSFEDFQLIEKRDEFKS